MDRPTPRHSEATLVPLARRNEASPTSVNSERSRFYLKVSRIANTSTPNV